MTSRTLNHIKKLVGLTLGLMVFIAVAFFSNTLFLFFYVPGKISNKLKDLVENGKWLS